MKPWPLKPAATMKSVSRAASPMMGWEPFELSPTRLRKYAVLTSGAMTTRLDRLEEAGYVQRSMDPRDRRGILVSLTEEGRELADRAIEARLGEVRRALGTLVEGERGAAEAALRKMLVSLQRDSIVPP